MRWMLKEIPTRGGLYSPRHFTRKETSARLQQQGSNKHQDNEVRSKIMVLTEDSPYKICSGHVISIQESMSSLESRDSVLSIM